MTDTLEGVPALSDLSYAEIESGQRWGPFAETLSQETSDRLRGALGTSRPGASAPLGVLPLLTLRTLRRALGGIIAGGILVRQHFATLDGLPAAGEVSIDVRVSVQEWRRSGLYTTFVFTLSPDASVAAVVEWTILAPNGDGR